MSRQQQLARARWGLMATWGVAATAWAWAPGRVTLIGDHTDYEGGLSLTMALPWGVAVAAAPLPGEGWRVASEGHPPSPVLARRDPHPAYLASLPPWARLAAGVLAEAGVPDGGAAYVCADLPEGEGLSSSAALELALAGATLASRRPRLPPREQLCRWGREAEHRYAGVPCGLMDQLTIAWARRGYAVRVDSSGPSARRTPFRPEAQGYRVAVVQVGADRSLAQTGYAQRLAQCREAAQRLGVAYLSQLTAQDLPHVERVLPSVLARRVRHVVTENLRVEETIQAASRQDWHRVGALWVKSHRSLRDNYESSHPLLDRVQAFLLEGDPPIWARITGGGFGGSLVALVPPGASQGLEERLERILAQVGHAGPVRVRWAAASPGLTVARRHGA